jgi:hypothetical protein
MARRLPKNARPGVYGESELLQVFKRLPKEVRKPLAEEMKKEMKLLRAEMKKGAPGRFKKLLRMSSQPSRLRFAAGFSKTQSAGFKNAWRLGGWRAWFVEFGSPAHPVPLHPKRGKKVLSDGSRTFGTVAQKKRQPANPFIQPAWDRRRRPMQKAFGRSMQAVIKRINNDDLRKFISSRIG